MKNRFLKLTAIAGIALAVTGCGGNQTLVEEPYEAVDYTLYPAPADAYVGDTMPFVNEDGELELYYLYDTDHNGQGYHPIWRYTTDNFTSYEDDGMMLNFGSMQDPDPAVGTGSVMQDNDGLYHLFYTGHNDIGNGGKGKECVMHATSTDRENWTKIPEDTFWSPEDYSNDDFRDPEVFWVEEDQTYWLLIAARNDVLQGVTAKYTSKDLKNWTYEGNLYEPRQQYMLECPDLFKMGDKYYLTYSWDCVTYYAMSDSINGPFVAPEDNVLDGNGFIFYAAKTAELDGNRYLCGWLGRAGTTVDAGVYQWAGSILNHQLVQHEDGTLGVKAPDSFADYFTVEKPFQAVKKDGKVKIKDNNITLSAEAEKIALADMGTRPATMTLECDVTLDDGGCAGFAFGGSEKDAAYTALCLDAGKNLLHYEGLPLEEIDKWDATAFTRFDFAPGQTHHVKLVCENEIVILYIDDAKALSSRILHSIDGAHIGVFADGCNASFENIVTKITQ
ncbi:MAG: family 43 glycosylhydrolase [Dorea sp.]|nr:family 43 glycosylhydrolase [Dorea sp.]